MDFLTMMFDHAAEVTKKHNKNEAQLMKEKRIASFTSRVEEIEDMNGRLRRGDSVLFCNTFSNVRKEPSETKSLSGLVPISALALKPNKTHKGFVLYCRSITRCMFMNSMSTLVEDASGQLVSLQVYNVPGVKTIWEAQAWLPQGTAIAIVEPFYKTRSDGTLGIRVDAPEEIIFRVSVEERLASLANDGLGQKRIHTQLREEGYEISKNSVRQKLQACKEKRIISSVVDNADSASCSQPCMQSSAAHVECSAPTTGSSDDKTTHPIAQHFTPTMTSSPIEQNFTPTRISGVPTIGTVVAAHGLQSDTAKHLNGQEGAVVGQDLANSRVLVDFGNAGEKAVKFENLRVVHASAPPLPIPRPVKTVMCLNQLVSEERWVEAIIFGQCLDMAFLSHSMPVELLISARASGCIAPCLIAVLEAVVEACRKRQSLDLSAGPAEMEDPCSVLPLCTDSITATCDSPLSLNCTLAYFLRGVVHGSIQDWQAAAADYQAAYVVSQGQMPFILKMAGWCTVSSTDGLTLAKIQENDALAQQMYELFLYYLDQLGSQASDNTRTMLVFSLWELAYVCQMRGSRLHPTLSKMCSSFCSEGPPAKISNAKAQSLFQKVVNLKDKAIIAEKLLKKGGIMNCHARDSVLRNAEVFRMYGDTDPRTRVAQPSADIDEAKLMHQTQSRLSALQRMEAGEIERLDKERQARDSGDVMSMMLLQMKEQAWASKRFEEGRAFRVEALAAREAEFRRRESQLAEQHASLMKEAARFKDDKCALDNLYHQEMQRQSERFEAELIHLRAEHEVEMADIQSQLLEAMRQREHEQSALLEGKRRAEQALQEALGAQEAEVDRWQREIQDKEGQIGLEQTSLKQQSEFLAKMQADLAERSRLLDLQKEKLQKERDAQQQFETDGALSLEMLGTQQSAFKDVSLHEIRFSQNSISPLFTDGHTVEQTTADLMSGKVQISDLPTIRVVQFAGIIWSLDNRRLRCMQAAFIKQKGKMIRVKMESLRDDTVRAEFHKKFTTGKDIVQRSPPRSRTAATD